MNKEEKLKKYQKEIKREQYKSELQQRNYDANTTSKRESEQKYYDMMESIESPGIKTPLAPESFIEGVTAPFKRWWPYQKAFAEEGINQMKKGFTDPGILKTPWNVGMGALRYVTSPSFATARTFAKEPVTGGLKSVGVPEPIAEVIGDTAELGVLMAAPFLGAARYAVTPKAERLATEWTKFWNPLQSLPKEKEFVLNYNEAKTAEDIAMKHMKKVYAILSPYELQGRVDIMKAVKGDITIASLPIELQMPAKLARRKLNAIGKYAVNSEVMTKATWLAHKDKYAPTLVGKHIFKGKYPSFFSHGWEMDMGWMKRKGVFTEDEYLEMATIQDAAQAIPYGVGRALTDIKKYRFYSKLSQTPDWVHPNSFIKVQNQRYTLGALDDEIEQLGKEVLLAAKGKGVASPPLMNRIAELSDAKDMLLKQMKDVDPTKFSLMPKNGSAWGEISGTLIRTEIKDTLMSFEPILRRDKSVIGDIRLAARLITNMVFKPFKVALNPPTMVRNTVSSTLVQPFLRPGATLTGVIKHLHGASDDVYHAVVHGKKSKEYLLAQKYGVFKDTFAQVEIEDIFKETAQLLHGTPNIVKILHGIGKLSRYYGKIDELGKFAIFKNVMEETGGKVMEAVYQAQKWGMDYSIAAKSVKQLRRSYLPFMSYTYKIAPLIYESVKAQSWKIFLLSSIPFALAAYTTSVEGIPPEEWGEIKMQMPEVVRKNRSTTVVPWKDEDGRWQWANLDYFFPWGNFLNIYRDLKENEFVEAIKSMGINPFLDLAVTFLPGGGVPRDTFTGKPLWNEFLDDETTKMEKAFWYVYNKFAPGVLTTWGAMSYTKRAITGEEDEWGRGVSWENATARWLGLNINPIEPTQAAVERIGKLNKLNDEFNTEVNLLRKISDPDKREKAAVKLRDRYKEAVYNLLPKKEGPIEREVMALKAFHKVKGVIKGVIEEKEETPEKKKKLEKYRKELQEVE